MFVLFDSVWDPNPVYGLQSPPIPGVHNSRWVQAPGEARLQDASQYHKLEGYVKDIVGTFEIGRASCRERVCQYVSSSVVAVSCNKKQQGTSTNKHTQRKRSN